MEAPLATTKMALQVVWMVRRQKPRRLVPSMQKDASLDAAT